VGSLLRGGGVVADVEVCESSRLDRLFLFQSATALFLPLPSRIQRTGLD